MKFKFNGDTYQVHPVAVKVMWVLFVLVVLYSVTVISNDMIYIE